MATPSSPQPNPAADWKADVKVAAADPSLGADATVLPEYTLLPDSPPSSALGPSDSASNASSGNADGSPMCATEGLTIFKLLWTGLLAIILPPAIVGAAALASAAAMLYGCGKMLEGIGRGLAVGPEVLWRACVAKRAKKMVKVFRGGVRGAEQTHDMEAGAIAI